jgi:hypothetical protein
VTQQSWRDLTTWGRGLLRRLVSLELIDRSLVVGAQAFSALIPLLIVVAGIGSGDGRSFADALIDRFDLTGDTAESVRETFGDGGSDTSLTVLGALIVFFSALSFTRAMQRTFELTWNLLAGGLLIYAPRALESSASEFGAIGIAFTLLAMLWAAGFVLVTAAAVGAHITTTPWSATASRGSATPRSSSSSPAHGS